ncbi:hypothetical protein HID58_083020 [Brassica napus]|uniref:Secreted protein n=1 Tax=Brassica napus TaxID=3708 RepID=A0ABQ7YCB0_BRANA|nr:hypothetical protein HID58_083020 [Brassica napus]
MRVVLLRLGSVLFSRCGCGGFPASSVSLSLLGLVDPAGRSSPYDMDLLPVSVGGAGVRCLLLLSSSLSVGVYQFWSFGLGLGGYVGCGHRWCVVSARVLVVHDSGFCSSPLAVAHLWRGLKPLSCSGKFCRWFLVTNVCGAKGLWICQPSPLNLCGGACSVVQCWSQDLGGSDLTLAALLQPWEMILAVSLSRGCWSEAASLTARRSSYAAGPRRSCRLFPLTRFEGWPRKEELVATTMRTPVLQICGNFANVRVQCSELVFRHP